MRSPFGRTGCAAEGPAEAPGCAGARLPRPRAPSHNQSIKGSPCTEADKRARASWHRFSMQTLTNTAQHSMRDLGWAPGEGDWYTGLMQ